MAPNLHTSSPTGAETANVRNIGRLYDSTTAVQSFTIPIEAKKIGKMMLFMQMAGIVDNIPAVNAASASWPLVGNPSFLELYDHQAKTGIENPSSINGIARNAITNMFSEVSAVLPLVSAAKVEMISVTETPSVMKNTLHKFFGFGMSNAPESRTICLFIVVGKGVFKVLLLDKACIVTPF